MDELAAAAGIDPLEFRLKNLKGERLRAVLAAAAERFGWKERKGHCGIACGIDKGGHIANCVEVEVKGKDFLTRSEILYLAAGAAPKAYDAVLSALSPDIFWQAPTLQPLLFRLRACLEQARMGTRLYIAGTEGFIGQIMACPRGNA